MKKDKKKIFAYVFLGLVMILSISCQPQAVSETATNSPTQTVLEPAATLTPTLVPTMIVEEVESFYFGVDLSYVNEMDDCGGVYNVNGEPQDAFAIFSDHGANLVRARLWVNPDWTDYSTLDDVARTFDRAQKAGMHTLLAMHYSDDWADPGKQTIPESWEDYSEEKLPDVVYQYTFDVISELNEKGVLPDFVQVGNEINSGLIKRLTVGLDWPRDAKLINTGIQAIRDFEKEHNIRVQIVLHVAQPENAGWWFREASASGVNDFDVIGLSYYPQWSSFRPGDVGPHVAYLKQEFDKEVMIVETAYPWTLDQVSESADAILIQGIRGYTLTIEGQRQFMIDLTQSLISNGGLGVAYWEPAWISTDCYTRWGQGSHWENATFFDFLNNNELHAGIDFLNFDYIYPISGVDGIIDESYGSPILVDESGDNFDSVPHLDLLDLFLKNDDEFLNLGLTIAGDIFTNPWGAYLVYIDTTYDDRGAKIDVDKRPITVAAPYFPEYRLDVDYSILKGTVSGSYNLYFWDGEEWQTLAFVGGAGVVSGELSTVELKFQNSMLGNAEFINVAVVSVGRGRVHSAGDILGINTSITDWEEAVVLDTFVRYDIFE